MARIRSKISNRFSFLILASVLAGLTYYAIGKENKKAWKNYQTQYVEMYKGFLHQEMEKAEQAGRQQDITYLNLKSYYTIIFLL